MLEFVDIAVFLWVTAWVVFAITKISTGDRRAILFVYLVFYLFFAVPLGLDVLVGPPRYTIEAGFLLASHDDQVRLLYAIYIAMTPVVWWITGTTRKSASAQPMDFSQILRRLKPLLYLLVGSPLIAWALAPDPSIYLSYGASVKGLLSGATADYHSVVGALSTVSILAAAGLLLLKGRVNWLSAIPYLPWIVMSSWLNGKRAVVALALLLLEYVFWQKGRLKGWRLPVGIILGALLFAGFSWTYQFSLRDVGQAGFQEAYHNYRIDYGRDGVTKMAIFAELHPDTLTILDHRGQSLLFDVTMMIPRTVWPNKPWPYAVYATSAMLLTPTTDWGWGITTSWLDEAIANFSWLGFVIGPLVVSGICRIGDRQGSNFVGIATILVACSLLVLQLPAFMPVFGFWVFTLLRSTWRNRRRTAGALAIEP